MNGIPVQGLAGSNSLFVNSYKTPPLDQHARKKPYDICCVGHITLDKVVTPRSQVYMAGGTSFYFSHAIRNMGLRYTLVTALAQEESYFADDLRSHGIEIHLADSPHTVYFENIYPENQDERTQRVLQTAAPFSIEQLLGIDAGIYHLGPLLAEDIPVEIISHLSRKGMVSLDVQGYLRTVQNKMVQAIPWPDKQAALPEIHFLKASRQEMEMLTAQEDIRKGAAMLHGWGAKEVIITMGSRGSLVYHEGRYYDVPAYYPAAAVVDATGCGDTYMAGYLSQRIAGAGPYEAGRFGAAMATLKIESSGPFRGTREEVDQLLANSEKRICIAGKA